VKSVETVQGEKSTLFLSFPKLASRESVHDAGDRSGVFAGDSFDERGASVLIYCCLSFRVLSGGLGRDSRGALKLVGASEACEGSAFRAGQLKESEGGTSRIVMIQSRSRIDKNALQTGTSKDLQNAIHVCLWGSFG
jgi:hypothetical protein